MKRVCATLLAGFLLIVTTYALADRSADVGAKRHVLIYTPHRIMTPEERARRGPDRRGADHPALVVLDQSLRRQHLLRFHGRPRAVRARPPHNDDSDLRDSGHAYVRGHRYSV